MDSKTILQLQLQLQETLRLLSEQVAQSVELATQQPADKIIPPVELTVEEQAALEEERRRSLEQRREAELDTRYEQMQIRFIVAISTIAAALWFGSWFLWRGFSLAAFITTLLLLLIGSLYAVDKFYLPGYSLLRKLREDNALLGKTLHALILSLGLIIAAATVSFPISGDTPYAPALPERGHAPDSTGSYNWPINIDLTINGEPVRGESTGTPTSGAKPSGNADPDRKAPSGKGGAIRLE